MAGVDRVTETLEDLTIIIIIIVFISFLKLFFAMNVSVYRRVILRSNWEDNVNPITIFSREDI